MQAPETWIGDWPTNARWHESGQALYFNWNPGGDFPSDSLYKVSRSGGAPQKVSPAERRSNPPTFDGWHHGEHVYTDDFSRKVYAADGDLYLYNRETDTQTRLTDTPAREGNPRFGLEEDRVLFERDDNLFSVHLSTGQIRQLTDVQSGREPQEGAPSPASGSSKNSNWSSSRPSASETRRKSRPTKRESETARPTTRRPPSTPETPR